MSKNTKAYDEVFYTLHQMIFFARFEKRDGTIREMWATRNQDIIGNLGGNRSNYFTVKNESDRHRGIIQVFDLQKRQDRMIPLTRLEPGKCLWYYPDKVLIPSVEFNLTIDPDEF